MRVNKSDDNVESENVRIHKGKNHSKGCSESYVEMEEESQKHREVCLVKKSVEVLATFYNTIKAI